MDFIRDKEIDSFLVLISGCPEQMEKRLGLSSPGFVIVEVQYTLRLGPDLPG